MPIFKLAFAYVIIFALGTGIVEIIHHHIANSSIILGAVIIFAFMFIGYIVISKRNILSRITSAFTLLALATITLRFDYTPLPDSLLLLLALGISYLGALPILHRMPPNNNKLALFISGIIITAVIFVAAFTYIVTVLTRMAIS